MGAETSRRGVQGQTWRVFPPPHWEAAGRRREANERRQNCDIFMDLQTVSPMEAQSFGKSGHNVPARTAITLSWKNAE